MVKLFSGSDITDFSNTTWIKDTDGIKATNTGSGNYLKIDKDYFCDIRHVRIKLHLGSDNRLILAFASKGIGKVSYRVHSMWICPLRSWVCTS